MSAPSYGSRWSTYAKQWDAMERNRLSVAQEAARRILGHKARYQAIEARTGVPWYWIGPTHYRESDLDFTTQLAQGDPLGRVSTHEPRGEGPYFDHPGNPAWERGALIALEEHGLNKVSDWRLEKLLYWWESYNGWGYFNKGVASAYVFAGRTIYHGGMYIRDGVWSSTASDPRVGCAPILKCLMEMDPSVKVLRETPAGVPDPVHVTVQVTEPTPIPTPEPQEPTPMTDTPTAVTLPHIDLAGIEKALVGLQPFLPIVSNFFPPLKVAMPFLPILIGLVQLAEKLETSSHDPVAIAQLIGDHLHTLADQLKVAFPTLPAPGAPA